MGSVNHNLRSKSLCSKVLRLDALHCEYHRRTTMKIVVIGGSRLMIRTKLVSKLCEHRHEAVATSPNSGGDMLTGEGSAGALKGASVVVDVSNSPSWEDAAVTEVLRNIHPKPPRLRSGRKCGTSRCLVGCGDRRLFESGHFRARSLRRT